MSVVGTAPAQRIISEAQETQPAKGEVRLTLDEGERFPESGAIAFLAKSPNRLLPDPGGRRDAHLAGALQLVRTPLFSIRVHAGRDFVTVNPEIFRAAPRAPLGGSRPFLDIALSRLEAGQWYHWAFEWDVASNRFVIFLNGVEQEALGNVVVPYWEHGAPELVGEVVLGAPGGPLEFKAAKLIAASSDGAWTTAAESDIKSAPALFGEGRTLYQGPLDDSDYKRRLLYENDFSAPFTIIPEEDLFVDGQRVREPDADQWVLEGDGRAFLEDGALVLETNDMSPPPRWDGETIVNRESAHLVLWLNRRFPDGILVEYTMEPSDSRRGLHILFFSAHHPNGGSVFQSGMSKRDGTFRSYVRNPDEILSYHISFWGSPYTRRGTSNLRKNNHFTILAVGDDRITHRGERPYPIRVLKDGGIIRAEVDGVLTIDFNDDGETFGPIYKDGFLGFRMMGDSGSIRLRDLRVWGLERQP